MGEEVEGVAPITSETDETLLQSALGGREEAWVALVDRYHSRGVQFVRRNIADPHLAQDVMQTHWASLIQAIRREVPERFAALFWALLKRRIIDEIRRKGRSHEVAALDAAQKSGDSLVDLQAGVAPDPAQEAVRSEEQSLLQQALAQLPDHYRLVLVARQFESRTNKETARLLVAEGLVADDGNVEKRVENYYYRGLKELRKQLLDLGYPDPTHPGGGAQ